MTRQPDIPWQQTDFNNSLTQPSINPFPYDLSRHDSDFAFKFVSIREIPVTLIGSSLIRFRMHFLNSLEIPPRFRTSSVG